MTDPSDTDVAVVGGGFAGLSAAMMLVGRAVTAVEGAADGFLLTDAAPGPFVEVDDAGATSVPGVFAAGDLARPIPSAPLAVAQGVMAGGACHRSLMRAFG